MPSTFWTFGMWCDRFHRTLFLRTLAHIFQHLIVLVFLNAGKWFLVHSVCTALTFSLFNSLMKRAFKSSCLPYDFMSFKHLFPGQPSGQTLGLRVIITGNGSVDKETGRNNSLILRWFVEADTILDEWICVLMWPCHLSLLNGRRHFISLTKMLQISEIPSSAK